MIRVGVKERKSSGNPRAIDALSLGNFGADGQTRTADRRFTKPLLYRLSYVGADSLMILARPELERESSRDSRLLRVGGEGGSSAKFRDQLNDEAGVRLRRAGVRF